ncbi:lipoprotein [Caballeronia peredens]|nr:lipoprotein [Caballeronia peredens]
MQSRALPFSFSPALLLCMLLCALLVACGGGGGGGGSDSGGNAPASPAQTSAPATASAPANTSAPAAPSPASTSVTQSTTPNVQPITVTRTPTSTRNMLQTSVTICVPGTNACQTVDNIQVDTGSHGLRVLASALAPAVALPLVAGGAPNSVVAECAVFGSGYTWGAVRQADVKLAGQVAASTSVQVIADSAVPGAATDCSQSGLPMLSASSLRGNGILGVGPFVADCGSNCSNSAMPRWYYDCGADGCAASAVAVARQVTNPVANFATDNNGVLIELPDVPDSGASSVTGTLTFGIGSQSNNLLGSATVLPSNSATGYVTTDFGGSQYGSSFIDSGSNAVFFPSTTLAKCGVWYCPATPQTFSATIRSPVGTQGAVSFTVTASTTLFGTGNFAFDNLAGAASGFFDWGLPFFYGRRVFTAIQGRATPAGAGPYYAF